MKRKLIIALVCINAALLIALAVGTGTQQAKAQTFPTTDYLLLTTQLTPTLEGVCVVDLGSRRMMAWRLRQSGNRYILSPFRAARDLEQDFRRAKTD
ncbi:MAG: hypothetical protein ISS78_08190 [Phycisphaerae bacterium]|nr:hypothetical protein [Phycisphaerae bacterium]